MATTGRVRRWWQALAIGLLGGLPQLASAQDPTALATGGVGWITRLDDRVRERFRHLLLAAPTRDLSAGWQLAMDLGRPALPLLWDMLQSEKANVESRLIMLGAVVLAGGVAEDAQLFQWLDQQKPMTEERMLAALLLALGPNRARPMPGVWSRCVGPTKTPEPLLAIAARLAASRFPGTEEGVLPLTGDDPGLIAAGAFAGLPVPANVAARWWNLHSPERHAELVWRGCLLGAARRWPAGGKAVEPLFESARQLLQIGAEPRASAHEAATWLLARGQQLRPDEKRLDWRLLQVALADPRTAERLQAWFGPQPQPRDEEPQRLAVCYALSRSPSVVADERTLWAADPRIRQHVAVALAWRLLAGEATPPIDAVLPGVPEWQFVRLAVGAPIERGALPDDPHLSQALQLARDGRLPREALRMALEEALWRWDSHPGLVPWRLERLLIRDLLLSGSNEGGGRYLAHVRPDQRYAPPGLDRKDAFFEVAVALFDFLSVPRGPVPLERRLAR